MNFSIANLIAVSCGAIAVILFIVLINSVHTDRIFRKNNTDPALINERSITYPDQNINNSVDSHYFIRLCWPLIIILSACVLPLMTWGVRQRLSSSISQAGLRGWKCSQFLAFQFLLAAGMGLLCMLIGLMVLTLEHHDVFGLCVLCSVIAGVYPRVWLRSKKKLRYKEIETGLPFFLDMVTLGLEAGMNLQTSVQLSLDHLHSGPLKEEWIKTIFEIRSGVTRAEALRNMSQRIELACIRQMVIAFIQSESMGLSLSKSISEFSRQQGQFRLLRAEKHALQAPVKMLFPLALCIFPCTFLVLGFPVVAQLLGLES